MGTLCSEPSKMKRVPNAGNAGEHRCFERTFRLAERERAVKSSVTLFAATRRRKTDLITRKVAG